jgi:group I intron endonuclease
MDRRAIYSLTGVYAIKFAGNDSIYVGATSKNFGDRTTQHLGALDAKRHKNKKLQDLFDQYGRAAFQVYVLETGLKDKKSLQRAEKRWSNALKKKYPLLNTIIGGRICFRKKPKAYTAASDLPIMLSNNPALLASLK